MIALADLPEDALNAALLERQWTLVEAQSSDKNIALVLLTYHSWLRWCFQDSESPASYPELSESEYQALRVTAELETA